MTEIPSEGIVPATWTPPERRFDRRLMKSKPAPKACVCPALASSRVRCVGSTDHEL